MCVNNEHVGYVGDGSRCYDETNPHISPNHGGTYKHTFFLKFITVQKSLCLCVSTSMHPHTHSHTFSHAPSEYNEILLMPWQPRASTRRRVSSLLLVYDEKTCRRDSVHRRLGLYLCFMSARLLWRSHTIRSHSRDCGVACHHFLPEEVGGGASFHAKVFADIS